MNQELLQAISDLMDQKLEPISSRLGGIDRRLDKVDQRLDILEYKHDRTAKKLNSLQIDVEILKQDVKNDIHTLQDGMDTIIELLKIHKIVPV